MIKAYRNLLPKFQVLNMVSYLEKGIVMAELQPLSRRSVDTFEFENGLMGREREHYDDITWLE